MERRPLGNTGLQVSVLGFGAGPVGDATLSEDEAGALLHGVLDAGINLIDTAPSYGASEERIGRHLQGRRGEFVLSTKCGYGVPGVEDWTGPCITQGIELALRRMRTDVIDVMHFHSCPVDVLERPGVVDALTRAVEQGKVRVAAYSGDNHALAHALDMGRFGSIQVSVNLFDQRAIDWGIARARERGVGVIAKRPLGNAPWRFSERPGAQDVALYWDRMRQMALDPRGLDWSELALRFAAFVPGVATCIVGTTKVENLMRNVRALEHGQLAPELVNHIRDAFRRNDHGWDGQI
ncbi:aldo/keto reductase [Hyalangium rubrum]|uniref:Aldo/keto reductase n=1 Tax=Hyalangium rubrum TaxID=3103134 RepID=A0ABU5H4H3_9BACT|nr:aldo/keto reductase [Hyalangium sp. s54d21]MDY7228381.1 aldo/keto reductase [Hyalangium sp. s54d21]